MNLAPLTHQPAFPSPEAEILAVQLLIAGALAGAARALRAQLRDNTTTKVA